MAQLSRANQLVFGSTGGTTEFGKIGSDAAGTPETTKDLEAIQSLSQYLAGLYGITASAAEPPRIEDLNALYFLMTSQLRYLFQNGVPEWHEDAEYFATVSYCQRGGVVYRSVTNDNVGNDPATDDGTNWEAGDASLRQLKFDLDELGFTGYALYTDKYLLRKKEIAVSMPVGMTIFSSMKLVPTAFSAAKSTANPSYPEYAPYIDRSAQQDLSLATWPKLAPLRDVKAMNADFTVTVTGSSVVLPNTAAGIAMMKNIIQDAGVSGWLNTNQTVDAAADYTTATTQRCINIAGTDYAITSATLGTRTLTVTGTPAAGSQTACFYTYRVAGSTNVRMHKLTGFVPVAEGDSDAEVMGGWRRMWRMQGHGHIINYSINPGSSGVTLPLGGDFYSTSSGTDPVKNPSPDGTNGTPLTGKTTDPRTMGQYVYTFAGVYL